MLMRAYSLVGPGSLDVERFQVIRSCFDHRYGRRLPQGIAEAKKFHLSANGNPGVSMWAVTRKRQAQKHTLCTMTILVGVCAPWERWKGRGR